MQPSKWEVWPWNWRRVRKARISKEDRDLFERYGEAVIGSVLAGGLNPAAPELRTILPHYEATDGPALNKFVEARNWLTECRDSQHRREQRLETIEIGVVALITVEIALSILFGAIGIYEAWKQGKVLDHMDASAAASAETMQTVRDEIKSFAADEAKMRDILQKQEDARLVQLAKRPELALYVERVPLSKARGTIKPFYETDDSATFHFELWNKGDATANKLIFRVLLPPKDFRVNGSPQILMSVPAPPDATVQTFTFAQDYLRSHNYARIDMSFFFPKGHPPFQVFFNADAEEVNTDTPLGTLTITPRMPSK